MGEEKLFNVLLGIVTITWVFQSVRGANICKRPRNKIRSRTAGFAEELWQPMKSLEEDEHMVRCEIQISASLKLSARKKISSRSQPPQKIHKSNSK